MQDFRIVKLSRRERQIMNIIYQRGHASVAQVLSDLPDPPTYSTVRDFGRERACYARKRWAALHLLSDATAASSRPLCAQSDCPDFLR